MLLRYLFFCGHKYDLTFCTFFVWYRDGIVNNVDETVCLLPHLYALVAIITVIKLLQQNHPVFNWRCWLTYIHTYIRVFV